MAGNYPDVNSWRMAYDVDGTQGHTFNEAYEFENYPVEMRIQLSNLALQRMNDENPATNAGAGGGIVLIFPELRDLDGAHISLPGTDWSAMPIQVSADTTNGIDGVWVDTSYAKMAADTVEKMRNPSWGTYLGIKAIRFQARFGNTNNRYFQTVHLYGEPAPGENLQRLEIWHPTLDQRLGPADLDWGDVPRNSEEIREFRVKNMHPTLTANDVRVAMSILTDTTPSVVGQQTISKNGVTWAAQQMLDAPLGPEEISPVMQVRRQTPSNATLSLWWYRLFADGTSWTEEV